MKIKIIEKTHELDLEEAVNEFIHENKILDLQYRVAMCYSDELEYSFSCLIIYEALDIQV